MDDTETERYLNILREPAEATSLEPVDFDHLLQLGAITALELSQAIESAPALVETAALHPALLVREAAFSSLKRLAHSKAIFIDALFSLALEHNHLSARQYVLSAGLVPQDSRLQAVLDWQMSLDQDTRVDLVAASDFLLNTASDNLRGRVLAAASKTPRYRRWGKLLESLLQGGDEGITSTLSQFSQLTEREREVCRNHLFRSAQTELHAQDAICRLFIQYEDRPSLELANQNQWLPQSIVDQALFFFLSGQNDRLKEIDFDGALLATGYETASKNLRRHLLTFGRQTGQTEWLRAVSRSSDVRYLSDLGDADWETVITRLAASARFLDLWRLAHSAPPRWAARIFVILSQAEWLPPSQSDQEWFAQLQHHARACWDVPFDLRPVWTFTSLTENLTCLAIEPRSNLLAAGTTTQSILLWDLPRGNLHFPSLSGPSPVTRALAFSPDGNLLAAAGGDQRIRLFRHTNGQVVKTLEGHRGLVRSIAIHPNGRFLVSAGFDGSLRSWRFPLGAEIARMESDVKEIFSVAILPGQDIAVSAGSGWNISAWKLSDGSLLRKIPSGSDGILHLAAAETSDLILSAGRDRALSVWNVITGLLVRRFSIHPAPITAAAFFPGDQIVATSGQNGNVYLWSLSLNDPIAILPAGQSSITAMALTPDGKTLVTASANGQVSVWNFTSLIWITRPITIGQQLPLDELEVRLKSNDVPPAEKRWLEFTTVYWRWASRFDIELGENLAIVFDEFDIQL